MPKDVINVIAEVRLLTSNEGGKSVPIRGSYRPNHNFFDTENAVMTIGFIEIPEGQEVKPGEAATVSIAFWWWEGLAGQVYVGREWRIQEGHQLVGHGRVLEIVGES